MNDKTHFSPETVCVQGGWTPKKGEPRVVPIYQSTTFRYETSEQMARLFDLEESGYFYTRLQNPTNDVVAAKIAELEGGVGAMLTSSGQAANFYAIFNICEAGDHFVCSSTIYGGTFNLYTVTLKKLGIDVTLIDPDDDESTIEAAFRPNTKALFGETLSNPGMHVLDIEKFARIAHRHGVPLIVDNTFATPINCRPFEWGADIVTHSTTKYMDGHATCVGGAIVDSGNFDWEAHADKFPGLTRPDESYHGLTYTRAAKRIPAQPRPRNPSSAYGSPLRKCAESRRIPRKLPTSRLGKLSGTEKRQIPRFGSKIHAARYLRRHCLRSQRFAGRRNPVYGPPETCRHRYPCGRRAHLRAAPSQPYSSSAQRRTTYRSRRSPRLDTPLGRYRKCR